jgi:hypothetical protein
MLVYHAHRRCLVFSLSNRIVLSTNLQELASVIPGLRTASEKRRASDPRFTAYGKLLARLETMNKLTEVPLDLNARLRMAKSEKELQELQHEVAGADEEDDEDAAPPPPPKDKTNKQPDLLLNEALHILADLTQSQQIAPQTALYPKSMEKRSSTPLLDWIQGQ